MGIFTSVDLTKYFKLWIILFTIIFAFVLFMSTYMPSSLTDDHAEQQPIYLKAYYLITFCVGIALLYGTYLQSPSRASKPSLSDYERLMV